MLATYSIVGGRVDVTRTMLLPQGIYALSRALLQAFVEGDEKDPEVTIGAVAGPTLSGIPLATGFILASFELDHRNAPPMLLIRKASGNLVEGLTNVEQGAGVLILEDLVVSGETTLRAIEALRASGLKPEMVITVVDREAGGLEAIKAAGVQAKALFKFSELLVVSPDDHILFMPDPGGAEGKFFFLPSEAGWQPCTAEQDEFLAGIPPDVRRDYTGGDESAADAVGVFFCEGILKP